MFLSVMVANSTTGCTGMYGAGGSGGRQAVGSLGMTRVEEHEDLMLEGEYGTGGRVLVKIPPNPYLEVDLIDPSDPILF